jgi:hypothetical protein
VLILASLHYSTSVMNRRCLGSRVAGQLRREIGIHDFVSCQGLTVFSGQDRFVCSSLMSLSSVFERKACSDHESPPLSLSDLGRAAG